MKILFITILILFFATFTWASISLSTCDQLMSGLSDVDYNLISDIDCTGDARTFSSIPSYTKTFDGKGYAIIGINNALITTLNGGTIQNLEMRSCSIQMSSASSVSNIGFFVGSTQDGSSSSLINCTSSKNILKMNVLSATNIGGIGGMIQSGSTVQGCITRNLQVESNSLVNFGGNFGSLNGSTASNLVTLDSVISVNTSSSSNSIGGNLGYVSGGSLNVQTLDSVRNTFSGDIIQVGGNIGYIESYVASFLNSKGNSFTFTSNCGGNVGYVKYASTSATFLVNYTSCSNSFLSNGAGGNIGTVDSANFHLDGILSSGNTFSGSGDDYLFSLVSATPVLNECTNTSNTFTGTETIYPCVGAASSSLVCLDTFDKCTSTSCGSYGVCMVDSGLCNCQSNYAPISSYLNSCQVSPTCVAVDYSNTTHLLSSTVYNAPLTSTFGSGRWEISMKFSPAQYTSRNVKILSSTGAVCHDFDQDLDTSYFNTLEWSQSIDSTGGANNCFDVINGNLKWNYLSSCLRSSSTQNLYAGKVVTITSLSNVNYNQTNFGKKDVVVSQFQSERSFSLNFQTNVTINSTEFSMDIVASKKIYFRVLSSQFDSSTLLLTLLYQMKVTAPLSAGDPTDFTSNNLNPTLSYSSETCDSNFCYKNITLVYDLNSANCSGVTENSFLHLTPLCGSSYNSTDCGVYLSNIGSKNVTVPIYFSLEWCPIEEKTTVEAETFDIFFEGSQVANQASISLSNSNILTGDITMNITSQVTGSVFLSASLIQLIMTDGITAYSVALNSNPNFVQSFGLSSNVITTQFNHTIVPPLIPLDFSKNMFYSAVISVVFTVPTNKRGERASKSQSLLTMSSTSSSFSIPSASKNSVAPSTSPTKNSSSPVIGIAIGVSVGVCVLFVVVIALFLRYKKKSTHSRFDEDDLELQSKGK